MIAAAVIGFLAAAWAAIGNYLTVTDINAISAGAWAMLGATLMDIWRGA